MNESGSFLIETCDESVVLQLEESLLLMNRRWKEICDAVDSFRQTHTSEQRSREFEQVLLKKLTWLQNSAVILKYPAECSSEEIKSQIEHLEV